ncbi:MAG: erythromycin esterase family protein [Isosphaeraceae bacterium]|nr:erythromycin esterase family protein [Isosphaeraceae bacterium]
MQHNWIRERATKLESCLPQAALSPREQQAVDRIVGDAAVIALGDMTHGSKEVLHSRERLLRFLIQERQVSIIVIEACFAATRRLNDYLVFGVGTAIESLAATEYWSCLNRETVDFVNWIREHNLSRHGGSQPVRVYGCDLQSIDGPRAELTRLLRDFARAGRLASEDCLESLALLDRLPSDRELFGSLEPLISEASSPNPDGAKIADIQARRTDYMSVVRGSAERLVLRLRKLHAALPSSGEAEDGFFFGRCVRLIEQVVEFHSPDGLHLRDRFLAENIAALRKHLGGARIALALHNLHVARAPLAIRGERFVPMGSLLAEELGTGYRVIGSAFHHGTYLAAPGAREDQEEIAVAHVPRSHSFEYFLHLFADAEGVSDLLLDFSPRGLHGETSPWHADLELRIGEAGSEAEYERSFTRQSPDSQYDGLIFLGETTPIAVLPEYYERARQKWGVEGHANSADLSD